MFLVLCDHKRPLNSPFPSAGCVLACCSVFTAMLHCHKSDCSESHKARDRQLAHVFCHTVHGPWIINWTTSSFCTNAEAIWGETVVPVPGADSERTTIILFACAWNSHTYQTDPLISIMKETRQPDLFPGDVWSMA